MKQIFVIRFFGSQDGEYLSKEGCGQWGKTSSWEYIEKFDSRLEALNAVLNLRRDTVFKIESWFIKV